MDPKLFKHARNAATGSEGTTTERHESTQGVFYLLSLGLRAVWVHEADIEIIGPACDVTIDREAWDECA